MDAAAVRAASILVAVLVVFAIPSPGRAVRAAESVSLDSVTPRKAEGFLDGLPNLPPTRIAA